MRAYSRTGRISGIQKKDSGAIEVTAEFGGSPDLKFNWAGPTWRPPIFDEEIKVTFEVKGDEV